MQDLKSIKSDCTDVFVSANPLTSIPMMYIATVTSQDYEHVGKKRTERLLFP